MVLKLVVDNTKQDHISCRNSCELFDPVTASCGLGKDANPFNDDASRCRDIFWTKSKDIKIRGRLIEDDFEVNIDHIDDLTTMINPSNISESNYPFVPGIKPELPGAYWFISNDREYGCWIINNSKQRLRLVQDIENPTGKTIYKSPVPLHNHNASKAIVNRMAWIVDAEGYGQYGFLINGSISFLNKND
ncbi:hypothetical protein [Terribacillus sp. DMT04]|uniref:hypothetical protein n=1 Tax=Terribacillus sp. DMT04 TaxID=2850441 RepID=UPI001C2C86CC|nr:hypothetical protein [Terribacillus sp. DMT04]QXE03563.1 hypothetical protein KS242_17400 [Terribacillus sp. DMT04]